MDRRRKRQDVDLDGKVEIPQFFIDMMERNKKRAELIQGVNKGVECMNELESWYCYHADERDEELKTLINTYRKSAREIIRMIYEIESHIIY